MRYRPLGESGLLVSVVGLGCNNFGGRLDNAATADWIPSADQLAEIDQIVPPSAPESY